MDINIVKNQVRTKSKHIYSKRNRVFLKSSREVLMNCTYKKAENHINQDIRVEEEVAVTANHEGDIAFDEIVNTLIENNEILKARMTDKQKKIYINYLKYKSYRKIIEECKEESNDSIGGISQKLNSAEFFTIHRNHKMAESLLNYYGS